MNWRSSSLEKSTDTVRAAPVAGVVLGLAFLALGCTEENPTPVGSPPLLETGADMVIQGLEHTITVKGVKEGDLYADSAFWYRDSSVYHLVNPHLILYTSGTGTERARVHSISGRFNPTTREMLAQGDVVLTIVEGERRVESQELNYNPNGDRIWSDSATTMVEQGRITEGLGFDSDLNFRRTVVGPGSIRNTSGGAAGPVVPNPTPMAGSDAGVPVGSILPGAEVVPDTLGPRPDTLGRVPDTLGPKPRTLGPSPARSAPGPGALRTTVDGPRRAPEGTG
jgi:LPS export ABC transporter protein LptC